MADPVQADQEDVFASLVERKKWRLHHIVFLAAGIGFLAWCADGVNLRPKELVSGIPRIAEYFVMMVPPKWGFFETIWKPAIETVYIAVWGNILASLIGLPLGILAARNITRQAPVRFAAKSILNLFRSISELIWAIFFVAAVGLGPFPGAVALGMNYAGILGRLYAEAMENVDPGPVEALQATGAGRIQVILFAIFPQVIPQFVTYMLYWFEVGVRSATVLGMVGAGGIGFELVTTIKLFEFRETAVTLLVIFGMVTIIDYASTMIRSRMY
jgi:phosphonate transport system permease protein